MSAAAVLRVAILWHFHQPDYRRGERAILPWARLHATKDYIELPSLHREFPRLRLTYNLSPILLEQIECYRHGSIGDEHAKLSNWPQRRLSPVERRQLLEWAFVGNAERMIAPYERYRELYEQYQAGNVHTWSDTEWLDVSVWMRLAWLGETVRQTEAIARLVRKGKHFSGDDLAVLCSTEAELLEVMLPRLRGLERCGLAELAVSPYHHPILPLLCSTDVVAESDPGMEKLSPSFAWREDAIAQVERAIAQIEPYRTPTPLGMWLAEGGISDDALSVLAECGVQWTASDRTILVRTLGSDAPTLHYRPYRWKEAGGKQIIVFFRDHALSDAIGFVYSSWDERQAVRDFLERLRSIRAVLIAEHGEAYLETAVVPIILDGENCWEYYRHNGAPFLRALYDALTTDEQIQTVTFGQVAAQAATSPATPVLRHVVPGSWIEGSFRIWIGHREDRRAWELLRDARVCFAERESFLSEDARETAYRHLLTAEGSDWFWWFGDDHRAAYRSAFDGLFRFHLAEAYRAMGVPVPAELTVPIMTRDSTSGEHFGAMHPATPPSEFPRDG